MTSSNGKIFRVTGLCAGNSPVTGEFPAQRPVTRSFDLFFDLRLNKRLVNTRDAGDLRRRRAHYNGIVTTVLCGVKFVIHASYTLNQTYVYHMV